jgi:hypothetical protein
VTISVTAAQFPVLERDGPWKPSKNPIKSIFLAEFFLLHHSAAFFAIVMIQCIMKPAQQQLE